jgi:hypothetical protein
MIHLISLNNKMLRLKIFFSLLFSAFSVFLFAQKFTAQASKNTVAVGEAFQIAFTLNSSGGNFRPPVLNDFEVYSGPNQSSNMSFINGSMSQSITLSYIIAAKKEGKVTIGSASIVVDGKTIQTNPISIEVVKNSATTQNQQQSQQQHQNNKSAVAGENGGDNIFAKTIVSKSKAMQGEQITVTHKIYSRYQLVDLKNIKFPDYTGFWAQDVPGHQTIQVTNENIDGVVYQVGELKRSYLFAQQTGKLEIKPLELECVVRTQSHRAPRDIFEQFFGGGYEDVLIKAKSKTVTIDISALPKSSQPEGFSGAVGDFSFKAHLSKDKVKANDAVNLTITISGKGNIKLLDPLKINFPEDFETYDPKISEKITAGANDVSGSKTFDYLIIPRHEGDYKIEPINFSFYDPSKNKYITLPSPQFNLHVEKSDAEPASPVTFNPKSKEDVKILGNDIRYIKTNNVEFTPVNSYFFCSSVFYAGIITPFFVFIGFLLIRKKHIAQNSDVIAVKSRKATKMAKKRLLLAEQYLKSNDKELFYSEVFKALFGYISDKFNIPLADLNKDHITAILKSKNVSEITFKQLIEIIDKCEYARYAPSAVSDELPTIYSNTVYVITKIEDEAK